MLNKQSNNDLTWGELFADCALILVLLFIIGELFLAGTSLFTNTVHSPETNITQEKHHGAASRRSE